MTTLANRPNTALLVIDVQNGVVGNSYNKDDVIARVRSLVEKARAEDVSVVWVQHNTGCRTNLLAADDGSRGRSRGPGFRLVARGGA